MKIFLRLLLLLGCSAVGVGLAFYLAIMLDASPPGSNAGPLANGPSAPDRPLIVTSQRRQPRIHEKLASVVRHPSEVSPNARKFEQIVQEPAQPRTRQVPLNPTAENRQSDSRTGAIPFTSIPCTSAFEEPPPLTPPQEIANQMDSPGNAIPGFTDAQQIPLAVPTPQSLPVPRSTPTKPVFNFPPIPSTIRRETVHSAPPRNPAAAAPADQISETVEESSELTNECRECLRQAEEALDAEDRDMFVNCFRAAMQAQPRDPKVPNLAAVSALRHNQAELAAQIASEGIRTIGESADLYRTLGAAQYRLSQHAEAQVSLGKSLSLDKSSALAYFLMGCTLNKLGDHEQADEYLQRARQIDPHYHADESK